MERSAATSTDEGGRVGADAGQLQRTAGVLCRIRNGERQRARRGAEAGQTRVGLGWAEAKRAALREAGAAAGRAGFGRGPRSEATAREMRNPFSNYIFKKFLNTSFKFSFEQENDIF